MPNLYLNLPAPAGNGVGAWVNVSAMGGIKTIVVGGTAQGAINIEMTNELVPTRPAPVVTFQNRGKQTVSNAARWMRARVSGFTGGGAPDVEVGSDDVGALFASLPATIGNGTGASVNTSMLGSFKTVTVGGPYRGTVLVEISEDNVQWGQCFVFTAPGAQSKVVAAQFMRTRRKGVPTISPGLPIVDVGGINEAAPVPPGPPSPGQSSCLVYQPGGGQAGPGTFATWAALMTRLAALRAGANGEGCYTIMFDDSFTSPAVIPAGGPYPMEDVVWAGDTNGFGSFVEIADGASFTGLRTFTTNLSVRNLNTVTSPIADLVDGDILRVSEFTNLETALGGVAFFDGSTIGAGGALFVIMTESATLGFYVAGVVLSMPTAGSFLVVLADDMRSTPYPDSLASGAGAVLSLSTASLAELPTVFPAWAGVIFPFVDVPPSLLPNPYLAAPSAVAVAASFSDWLRLDASGGAIAQPLPSINGAFGSFSHPGCMLVVSEEGGGSGLTVTPAAGDTINGLAAAVTVPAGGALILMSDGVSDWKVVAGSAGTGPSGDTGLYTCPAAVAVGNAVYISAADTVDQADASAVATMPAVGLVLAKLTATTCVVLYSGELGGFAGLTAGARYFVSLVAGGIVLPGDPNFPVALGSVVQIVGIARNATTLVVDTELDYVVL